MTTSLTVREASAAVLLRRLMEQFAFTKKESTSLKDAMSRVPPLERECYRNALEALIQHRLLGEQSGELFVSQYGALLLEYAIPEFERRQLPFTDHERAAALSTIQRVIASDSRFDPE